jgi:hypothetical protein
MEALEACIARDLFDVVKAVGARYATVERESAARGASDSAAVPEASASSAATSTPAGAAESDQRNGTIGAEDVFEISVEFLELLGQRASDLLAPSEKEDGDGNEVRAEVVIQEDKVSFALLFSPPF